jgi:hypothetical protein
VTGRELIIWAVACAERTLPVFEQTSPMITDDRRLLVAGRVDPQHPQPGAVVDGGELVVLAARGDAGQGRTNLTSIWNSVARQLFLVALPALVQTLVPL